MFKQIDIRDVKDNAVKLISDDWALLTAGNQKSWNTMTVSWGGIGELWGRDVAFVFVRPQRHTMGFIESSEYFTLSFFGGKYKKELAICGSKSGRDTDKAAVTGLIPVSEGGGVWFEQAQLVLECKKIAAFNLPPEGFIDKSIEENYLCGDYHRMFVGEIARTLQKN